MRKSKQGDCYEVHAKALVFDEAQFFGDGAVYLCHGTVYHEQSGWHGHCWLEQDGFVSDIANGHDITMPAERYYALGHVKDVKRYTAEQARERLLKEHNWGAWG